MKYEVKDPIRDIMVVRVDVPMLRKQRNALLEEITDGSATLEGLVNLLDHMLDVADGFPVNIDQGDK